MVVLPEFKPLDIDHNLRHSDSWGHRHARSIACP
jgi:hypothetical protein